MDYPTARTLIRSGDLISQSHGDWKTWSGVKVNLVRMFTRRTDSHVGLAWVVAGRVFILEAVKPKLRIYPMSKIGDFYWLPLQAPWAAETEELALSKVGVLYSELTAMRAYFGPLEAGNVRECAAYVLTVLKADGIDLGDSAIPGDVVLAAMQRGSTSTLVAQKEIE